MENNFEAHKNTYARCIALENRLLELESEKAELLKFINKVKIMAEGYFDYKPKEMILRCSHILNKFKEQ